MESFIYIFVLLNLLTVYGAGGAAPTAQSRTEAKRLNGMTLSEFRKSGLLEAMESGSTFHAFLMKINNIQRDDKFSIERTDISSAGKFPNAGCDLYDETVRLPNPKADVFIYPSCIRVQRCGGCASHPARECSPTIVRNITIPVDEIGISVLSGSMASSRIVEEHLECETVCRVKASDCDNKTHKHDSYDCRCMCIERHACPTHKWWNETVCACTCKNNLQHCGDGYKYNSETCSCEKAGGALNAPPPVSIEDRCSAKRCPRRYKAKLLLSGNCQCKRIRG